MTYLARLTRSFLLTIFGSLQVISDRPLTPVIGGICRLGTADIQIGGKQTQFFLRCELNAESKPGEGIWVVKSRNVQGSPTPTISQIPASMVVENTEVLKNRQVPVSSKTPTRNYVCDLDPSAQDNGFCLSSEQCLQPVFSERTAFLHCDSATKRWQKKHCQNGFSFDFERQSCVMHSHKVKSFRQFPTTTELRPADGLICTYTQCSPSAPCSAGTCNNGYCCTPASSLPDPSSSSNPHSHSFRSFPAETQKFRDNLTHVFHSAQISVNDWSQQNLPVQPDAGERRLSTRSHSDSEWQNSQNTCSSGFTSPLKCSHSSLECPAGLFCDTTAQRCCPLLLAQPEDGVTTAQQPSHVSIDGHPTHLAKKSVVNSGPFHYKPHPRSTLPVGGGNGMRRSVDWQGRGSQTHSQLTPFHRFQRTLRQNGIGIEQSIANQFPTMKSRRIRFSSVPNCCSPCSSFLFLGGNSPADRNFMVTLEGVKSYSPSICPGGTQSAGNCNAGYCPHSYHCIQPNNLCCFAASPALPAAPPLAPAYACPGGLPALGQCISGRCGPGYACSPASNACCAVPTAIPATVCPDGTQAAGACVNYQCGTGFTCNQGLCCSNSSQTPRCLDGSQAIGACIQGTCGTGYSCTTGNICCPATLNACPGGQASIGQCVNGRCPPGFTCIQPANQCCPDGTASTTPEVTCVERDSNGPCVDGNCPQEGYKCDVANNWCCPQTLGDPVGPCIVGEGGDRLCPDGYACTGDGEGQCFRLDTGTCAPEDQAGPCVGNKCDTGFTCDTVNNVCCKDGTFAMMSRRRKRMSAFMRLISHN